jgi:hypothetical protein
MLVQIYTSQKLTRDNDKLPALSGLARSIAEYTGDTYCAGIWKSHIIMGLYWEVKNYGPIPLCTHPEHTAQLPTPQKSEVIHPASYRAPSWSWASIDAEISFHPLELDQILAECLECPIVLAGIDPFGRVSSAFIKLRVST